MERQTRLYQPLARTGRRAERPSLKYIDRVSPERHRRVVENQDAHLTRQGT